MVSGDHEHIVLTHLGHKLAQLAVKHRSCFGIAVHITAVSISHIKVHQVHEAQAFEVLVHDLQCLFHAIHIVLVDAQGTANAATGEDIGNLAYADGFKPLALQGIHHGVPGGIQGEVMATGSALVVGEFAYIGAGNDPAYAVLTLQNLTGSLAVVVKLLHRHISFVSSNLEHAVSGGIDDEAPGLFLLLAVIVDDCRAGVGLVAENLLAKGLLQLLN